MSWIFVDVAETKRDVVHGYTWISAVSGTDAPPPGSPQGTGGMGGGLQLWDLTDSFCTALSAKGGLTHGAARTSAYASRHSKEIS